MFVPPIMFVVDSPMVGVELTTTGAGFIGIPIGEGLMMTGLGFDMGTMPVIPDIESSRRPSSVSTENEAFCDVLRAIALGRSTS